MKTFETITVARPQDHTVLVTLNRPERLNAITGTMTQELCDYFRGLRQNHEVRIVVMRGAGRAFCAGLDIKEYTTPGGDRTPDGAGRARPGDHLFDIVELMRACPQPIVALVHGPACGGGFAFARNGRAFDSADRVKDINPSNLTDDKWDRGSTDGEIFTNIKDGIGPKFDMKPMKAKMMDPDIWNVINYLHSLSPKTK